MDGIPALDPWDVVIEVLLSSQKTQTHIKQWETAVEMERSTSKYRETQYAEKSGAQIRKTKFKRSGNRGVDELSNVDHVVTNASSFSI